MIPMKSSINSNPRLCRLGNHMQICSLHLKRIYIESTIYSKFNVPLVSTLQNAQNQIVCNAHQNQFYQNYNHLMNFETP